MGMRMAIERTGVGASQAKLVNGFVLARTPRWPRFGFVLVPRTQSQQRSPKESKRNSRRRKKTTRMKFVFHTWSGVGAPTQTKMQRLCNCVSEVDPFGGRANHAAGERLHSDSLISLRWLG